MISNARPKPKSMRKPTGSAALFERQLGHIQAELIGFYVEVPQTVGHRGWIIEILVRIKVNEPAEIDWPNRPDRSRGGARAGALEPERLWIAQRKTRRRGQLTHR